MNFLNALKKVQEEGGKVICGGSVQEGEGFASNCYVVPAGAEVENRYKIVQEEPGLRKFTAEHEINRTNKAQAGPQVIQLQRFF